jgi:hypothetical protein
MQQEVVRKSDRLDEFILLWKESSYNSFGHHYRVFLTRNKFEQQAKPITNLQSGFTPQSKY